MTARRPFTRKPRLTAIPGGAAQTSRLQPGWLQAEKDPALQRATGSLVIETTMSPWLVAGLLGTGFVLGFVAAVLALGVPR